ncbi:unnamed protein product [Meloidogyne enterolobii]|uniref:Uncharacterized protein n=1 Tax=Meloidogyne enterolobii TaxID=390850 RepID=A0ACB0YX62_MELEN
MYSFKKFSVTSKTFFSMSSKSPSGNTPPKEEVKEKESEQAMDTSELASALPKLGEEEKEKQALAERKEPTEEDFARYNGYIGQKWTGICKWFNVTKGFGFILPDFEEAKEHGDDIFVHQSSLQMPGFRSLDEGEAVEFNVRLGKRGLEAENVTGLNGVAIRGHRIHPLGKRKEKEIRCYKCGQFGHHKAAKCKRMQDNVKVCYICFSNKHLIADCPKRTGQGTQPSTGGGGGRGRPGPSIEG